MMKQASQVHCVLPNKHEKACKFQEELLEALTSRGWPEGEVFGIRLALEEALTNAIRHGNHGDPAKAVYVQAEASTERLWIAIYDQGKGFCPDRVPDCTAPENLEAPSGRGIALMRRFMSRVEYDAKGSRVEMERVRCAGEPRRSPGVRA